MFFDIDIIKERYLTREGDGRLRAFHGISQLYLTNPPTGLIMKFKFINASEELIFFVFSLRVDCLNTIRYYLYIKMKSISKDSISHFQKVLLVWFEKNGRDFPWRKGKMSIYHVIISEILLQRTKASAVAKHYPVFLKKFPNWKKLGLASDVELQDILKPLGLHVQRAKRLYKLSREMKIRGGRFPKTRAEIEKMPMVGQYIANAFELLVLNKKSPLLDVNMARLLERYFGPRMLSDIRDDPYLQELSYRVVDMDNPRAINWAILDYAQLVCKARKPHCRNCSLNKSCYMAKSVKNLNE